MSHSLLPQSAFCDHFSDAENNAFVELHDDADIDRLVDALFGAYGPDELTKVGGPARRG